MFGLQTPKFLLDLEGKPSTMRASAFIAVLGGITILVSGAFGWATGALGVKAEHGCEPGDIETAEVHLLSRRQGPVG